MTEQQVERMKQEFELLLDRKNLTINGASERLGIDRGVLTRWRNGNRPKKVEIVERFARGLGQDVNHWRELCGYDRIESRPAASAEGWAHSEEYWERQGLPRLESSHAETDRVREGAADYRPGQLPPDLFGKQESPQDRYHRKLGEMFRKYSAADYKIPRVPQNFGVGAEFTEEIADSEVLAWLEKLARLNPGKPVPELEEAEG